MRPASWCVTLVAATATIVSAASVTLASPTVGEPAPALVVPELSGETFDLAKLRGKVVVVNFWATWCPPCRQEMPALNAFYGQYHSSGVEMIGISLDRPRDRSDVQKVMQAFSYPAAILEDAQTNDFGDPAELPETFVVDRSGVVRDWFTPDKTPVTEKSLSDAVLPLLSQGSAPHASANPEDPRMAERISGQSL